MKIYKVRAWFETDQEVAEFKKKLETLQPKYLTVKEVNFIPKQKKGKTNDQEAGKKTVKPSQKTVKENS